jgi:hypothetical protein
VLFLVYMMYNKSKQFSIIGILKLLTGEISPDLFYLGPISSYGILTSAGSRSYMERGDDIYMC